MNGEGHIVIADKEALDQQQIEKLEKMGFLVIIKGGGRDVHIYTPPRLHTSLTESK